MDTEEDPIQSIDVVLTDEEMALADHVAQERQRVQRGSGRRDAKVIESGLDADVQGCRAELAVSRAFNLAWDGKIFEIADWEKWRYLGHDVSGVEVRSTQHENGRLILHPSDKDDSPYILVRAVNPPAFTIVGWCWGRTGKKDLYWHDVGYGRPCYYYPNVCLKPIGLLTSILNIK